MHLRQLAARSFRKLAEVELELHPQLNLIIGDNAAGKSTVLEAVSVLGRGRSQRCASSKLATIGQSSWQLESSIIGSDALRPVDRVTVAWRDRESRIELNDKPLPAVDLVRMLPILLLDPGSHRIIEDGPSERRRLLDWGVFHVEHRYQELWSRLSRVLRQRNSALRAGAAAGAIEPWSQELIAVAKEVNEARTKYLDELRPLLVEKVALIWPTARLSIRLMPGWPADKDYADMLRAAFDGDIAQGHTRYGPHRAELIILSDNHRVLEHISRGEQKLMVAALMLAQAELYERKIGRAPLLLIDDFPAELSTDSQHRLANVLKRYPGQKFISALEPSTILAAIGEHAMFHVEHGNVTREH